MVSTQWFGATERSVDTEERASAISTHRSTQIDDLVAGFERLMQRLADTHAPDFLEIAVTMPQAKLLYLLGASGELHMSELVTRLGVSLSTVSGLVDRVVDAGLASRREDPDDRRQVVVSLTAAGADFLDRFRELNARQMRELLAQVDDAGLRHVEGAIDALMVAAERLSPVVAGRLSPVAARPPSATTAARPAVASRKDPA